MLGRPAWSPHPPPWKVTSLSSTLAVPLPPGAHESPQGDPWGTAAPPSLLSPCGEC